MSRTEHRNVIKKKTCPSCDHFHGVANSNVPFCTGVCVKDPPTVFVVGMAPTAASVIRDQQPEMVPVLRSFYPPVGPNETCSHWTQRAAGEA